MPVGTEIRAGVAGVVLVNPTTTGSAYGSKPVILRAAGIDHVLGHLDSVAVSDGERVRAGQLLGSSGMSGTEDLDGPHLHFETRPAGATVESATDPWPALRASRS